MATTGKTKKQSNPTDDLNAPGLAVVSSADAQAAAAVSTLGLIQKARLANQNRTLTLTVAAYGKGSTRATAAKQAVAATTAASARLSILSQQTSTPAPSVAATGWALQGRLYSSELAPLAGYAVFMVDAQKTYLADYGFAYTDTTGYFLISSDGGSATENKAAGSATSVDAAGKKSTAASTSPAQSATTPAEMFVQITDSSGNPVLLSTTAFVPVVGQAIYQVITLPAGAAKLGDPPAQVRSVALPPTLRK